MRSRFLTLIRRPATSRRLTTSAPAVSAMRAPAVVLILLALVLELSPPPAASQPTQHPAGWSEATHTNRAAPDYERLFSTDHVHEIRITITPSDYAAMQQDLRTIGSGSRVTVPIAAGRPVGHIAPDMTARDPIYVPVTVRYDDRVWPGVGMRYKGNSSLMTARSGRSSKVPFRLDFDRYEDEVPGTKNQRFFGFEKLTFSSNYSDNTMIKEVLATEIFRDRGVPAARAAFYRVFIDTGNGDEYWGLYSMIEDPADGAMLDAQFGSDDGNLYKPNGPGADWSSFYEQGFEKKTNEKAADFSDVEAAIEALHAPQDDAAAWRERLEAVFDVDGFLRWLAVNSVIQNWDSYGRMAHNYYLYGDPSHGGRLTWIPWDHNMAFAMSGRPVGGFVPAGSRMRPIENSQQRLQRLETLIRERGQIPELSESTVRRELNVIEVDREGIESILRESRNALPLPMSDDDVLFTGIGNSWPLIGRVLADEVYAARYRVLLEHALGGLAEPAAFEARARSLHAMVAESVVGEHGERPARTTLGSSEQFLQSLDGRGGLIEQFRVRHEQVRALLADSPDVPATD